eukprot:CAMPEP_0183729712 /NCGR_PEP_ID=MMETSP0737-20130205/31002_1 /TAXON_ID=385413 /ORGANISM="Thalassiosira miniscula, Strain CCMP1093" /LENGTH=473 /DNA_ID=CAMNT_0025961977 /DNA_START=22 /DNA_END=1441 /DNA_ORIENTATION=+
MITLSSTLHRWLLQLTVILSSVVLADAFLTANCNNAHHRQSTIQYMSKSHHKYSHVVNEHHGTNDMVNTDIIKSVDTLINERMLARKEKNFHRADVLLDQLLKNHNVILNDSDKTWRIGTKREVKKRIHKKSNKAPPRSNDTDSDVFRLSSKSGTNKTTLSEADILTMLGNRLTAQRSRDYEKADSIRNTLKSAGVYIDDGVKEFRWDNIPFKQRGRTVHEDSSSSSSSSRGSSWGLRQSDHSIPLPSDEAERIVHDLLRQRSNARSSGNYAISDSIRDRLYETYNIRIDDRLREWSCGGFFGDSVEDHWTSTNKESLVGYTKSELSNDVPHLDEVYIQSKVDERMRAKRTRNYMLSDSIRDYLYREYDVTIHDKKNLWSVGGDFGEGNEWNYDTNLVKGKRDMSVAKEDDGELDAENEDSTSSPIHEVSDVMSREQLERLTVVQLKEKLRNSGLPVSGTKAKLKTDYWIVKI